MGLYLDSAIPAEAQRAAALGLIVGITTNPALIARSGQPREDVVAELCRAVRGPVFVQLTSAGEAEQEREGWALHALSPSQVHVKVPCTLAGLAAIARLSAQIPCAATAVYSPAQAWLAAQAGARYVIPYVNRATRLLGDGVALVRELAGVLAGTPTTVLAASIKSPEEAVAALAAGARHLTLPLALIEVMAEHALTQQAVEEFKRHGA